MVKYYLMRHPPVKVRDGLCYGQLDVPLSDSVAPWVELIRSRICLENTQVITSDLQRCRLLAEALGRFQISHLLRELNFGTWEGQLWQDLPRHETERWTEDVYLRRPPQGESFADVIKRAIEVTNKLEETNRPALLITHAGFMRAFLVGVGLMSIKTALAFRIAFGEILEVSSGPNWQCAFLEGH